MPEEAEKDDKATLNLKQRLFLDAYIKEPNATKAAISAGYSAQTARVQGPRLLQNVAIRAEIDRIANKITESTELSAEWVLSNLKNVAERCMQAVPVMEKVDGKWEETGEFKFDSTGANKALELLGKNLALFTDKVDSTVTSKVTSITVIKAEEVAL